MDDTSDLAFALHLADVAATVTMPAFGQRLDVELKSDATVVTAVDRAAEQAVRAAVREHRPDDGVLGEEGGFEPGTSGRVWVVDPIDGTRMFAEGIPVWTTLIGLRDADRVVVGVADAPALGLRHRAALGRGAWEGDRRLSVTTHPRIQDAFVLHSSLEEWAASGEVARLVGLVSSARGSRGMADAWAHLMVARGSAEIAVEATACHEWDWSATSLVVSEAGGMLTSRAGGEPYPGCHLLVSNGAVHAEALALVGVAG